MENNIEYSCDPACAHCGYINLGWKVSHRKITVRRCDNCRKKNNVHTFIEWRVEKYQGEIYKRKLNKKLTGEK